MSPPGLGKKHACFHCRTAFYDLNRSPIVCPKCGATPGLRDRSAPPPSGTTGFDRSHAVSALAFWRSCEYFATGRVEPLSDDARNPVLAWGPGTLAPWHPEHPCQADLPQLAPPQVRLYVVTCGLYDSGRIRSAALSALLGEPLDDEAGGHPSATMTFLVNDQGFALRDSLVVAMAPWAMGRTFHPGPGDPEWLSGFDKALDKARERWWLSVEPLEETVNSGSGDSDLDEDFAALDAFDENARLVPLVWDQVREGLDEVCAAMSIPDALEIEPVARVRVATFRRREGDVREFEIDVLNSFFVRPLTSAQTSLEAGSEGAALRQYLLAPDRIETTARIDLRTDEATRRRLANSTPVGRWPAPGGQHLDPSQQLAVNALFDTLGERDGLFAINGPPGTGKTTLLRDLIAAVVTLRAVELSKLSRPGDAFATKADPARWHRRFEDFGIVIASSNNAALENITREVPYLDAIDPALHATADYFKPWAERLQRDYLLSLAETAKRRAKVEPRAWGLVAATLGRHAHRKQFVDGFWWKARTGSGVTAPLPLASLLPAEEGFRRQLERWSRAPIFPEAQWQAAAKRFRDAVEREAVLRSGEPGDPAAWNQARGALFMEALALHRVFIEAAAGDLFPMLNTAMELLKGTGAGATPEAIRDAWAALFLLVPAISTTFASFGAMFARNGGGRLGWLLIDEAGQASPQSAVGAIAHAKRVVVMGDPQQLEPVVETPPILLEALRIHHHLPDGWTPGVESVQTVADRVARHGTYLELTHGLGRLWVGAPLLVHRRCDEPMFGLANAIAYGGLMRQGIAERPPLTLPASGWLDVGGEASSGHWIPKQGEALTSVLKGLLRAGVSKDELFLISPYRTVANELRRRAQAVGFKYAGTVHTVQGKEADVVVLVLGGDRTRPRARAFATRRPNLLNVAMTRAKRRLYVLGDRGVWSQEPYFRELANALAPLELGAFEACAAHQTGRLPEFPSRDT